MTALDELRAKRAEMRATVQEIHDSAVEAVTENYKYPAGVSGFFARHQERMARVAAASGTALLDLDGPNTMQTGMYAYSARAHASKAVAR